MQATNLNRDKKTRGQAGWEGGQGDTRDSRTRGQGDIILLSWRSQARRGHLIILNKFTRTSKV